MEFRPLNITLISADGIKDVKLLSKMDVYVDVSIAGYPQSRKRTFVHKNAGTKPSWNFRMEFIVDEPYLTRPGMSLFFQLMAESTITSDKLIGSVTVPINELFQSHSDAAHEKTVDYPVYTASGKPKGSLKFSYRFGDKFTHQPEVKQNRGDEPVTAYPAAAAPHPGYYNHHPQPMGAYPPQASGYGYGYGYHQPPPPPAAGYGYAAQGPPRKGKMGMGGGMGLGLGAGLLGGLLLGEMASDVGDAAAYADGYGDAMDDMGGDFDF